jgi:hypothetical protein
MGMGSQAPLRTGRHTTSVNFGCDFLLHRTHQSIFSTNSCERSKPLFLFVSHGLVELTSCGSAVVLEFADPRDRPGQELDLIETHRLQVGYHSFTNSTNITSCLVSWELNARSKQDPEPCFVEC